MLIGIILLVFVCISGVAGEYAEVEDVTSLLEEEFPDDLNVNVKYNDGTTEVIKVKRNPTFLNDVTVESLSDGRARRHATQMESRAEYLSERAAFHVTAEREENIYKRSLTGLVYRNEETFVASSKRDAESEALLNARLKAVPVADKIRDIEGMRYDDELMPPKGGRTRYAGRKTFPTGTKLTVDIMAVIDYSLYVKLHNQYKAIMGKQVSTQDTVRHIHKYYGIIWAGIIQRYHDASFSNMTVTPRLVKMLIATTALQDHWLYRLREGDTVEGNNNLAKFAKWLDSQKRHGRYKDIDHTMIFTGLRIYNWKNVGTPNMTKSFAVVGIAFTGGICGLYSVSVIEENLQLRTLSTAAHELGHSLGAGHDEPPRTCPKDDHHVMCPYVTYGNRRTFQNVYKFSQCSLQSIHDVMERLNKFGENCMADEPVQPSYMQRLSQVKPGIRFDLHAQCKAYTGDQNSYYCDQNTDDYMRDHACYQFKCFQNGRCQSSYKHHALYGTPCGGDRWCVNGVCRQAHEDYREILDSEYYGVCPLRDPEICHQKPANICKHPVESAKCCNRCLRERLEAIRGGKGTETPK